jgi:hypothetical protein
MECKGLDYDVCRGEILTQIKSAPQLFRVVRRPNSPPPELLNHRIFSPLLDVNPTLVPAAGTKWLSFNYFR